MRLFCTAKNFLKMTPKRNPVVSLTEQAQALYKKALGAEQVAVIKNLYSHDDAIMIATVAP